MKLETMILTDWPKTVRDAKAVQETLARRVVQTPLGHEIRTIAGVDAAFSGGNTIAAATLFDYRSLTILEQTHAVLETTFPYIPGYLSFREGPALLTAIAQLSAPPDLLIVDGQGIAHPRRIGIASFLGVLLDIPSIGCAKSRLTGVYAEPPQIRGSWSPLTDNGETIGAVLRTKEKVKPVFVSPGHLITLAEAVAVILRCAVRYRLPEPQRAADSLAAQVKRELAAAQQAE
jgi:deoxyribonuclease V